MIWVWCIFWIALLWLGAIGEKPEVYFPHFFAFAVGLAALEASWWIFTRLFVEV